MTPHDPRFEPPPTFTVPPGWERFQPPRAPEPVLQVIPIVEAVVVPAPRRSTLGRLWRQIGGGSLLFSIGVHVALIAAAGIVILSTQMTDKTPDFVPAGHSKAGEEASKELSQRVKIKTQASLVRRTRTPKTRIQINRENDTPLPPADSAPLPDASEGFGMNSGRMTASVSTGFSGHGPSRFLAHAPNFLASRCSTQSRLEKLRQNGGTQECELAVSRSLEWLKTQQNADGSWGRANKAAMTGLSLLCFLGRCETPESLFYGDTVRDGMLWLVELARKNPHAILSENPQANSATYEHGIATYALGEMYSFYRLGGRSLPGLRDAFENGVRVIIENQNERGAWSYGGKTHAYDKDSGGEDLSVAGWQFQALKAAKNSGLKFDGLDKSIERCCDYLESKQTKDGGFGKTNRDGHYNQWSLTGCGVLGLQTLAKNKVTAVKKGIRFLRDFLTAEPLDWNRNCNLYCWYYYTQAFFQAGGDDWKFYNAQFLPQVLAAQQPDGSFQRGRPNWPAGDAADPIYRQALCTLQLEVYYRYLKVADREADSVFER